MIEKLYSKKLGILMGLAVLGAVSANADDIVLGQPGYGGNGCPQGTLNASITPDGKTLSVLFDQFQLNAGGTSGVSMARKACNISIPVHVPQGMSVSLFQIDYRGFNTLPPGASSRLNAQYFFAGQTGATTQRLFAGPVNEDFTLSDSVQTQTIVWSDCGADVNLRTNMNMFLMTANNQEAMAGVDSADIKAGIQYQLQWKVCGQDGPQPPIPPQPNPNPIPPNPFPQPAPPIPQPNPNPFPPNPFPQPTPPPIYRSCAAQVAISHPDWRSQDLNYVCTARGRLAIDTNPIYTNCVVNQSRYSANGEFIINTCLAGNQPNPNGSCQEQVGRVRPDLRTVDRQYLCSARSRIAEDSNPTYTQCVVSQLQYSRDGEFIINTCINGGQVNPNGSCDEQVARVRPDLRDVDRTYLCTARSRIATDSNPNYTQCTVNQLRYSSNGEFIIDHCLAGLQPDPNGSCQEQVARIRPDLRQEDKVYLCSARSTIREDSDANYTYCVTNLLRSTGDGEYIINSCRR